MAAPIDPSTYGPRAGIITPLPLAERGVPVITSCFPRAVHLLQLCLANPGQSGPWWHEE
jgi:hypothetical protein